MRSFVSETKINMTTADLTSLTDELLTWYFKTILDYKLKQTQNYNFTSCFRGCKVCSLTLRYNIYYGFCILGVGCRGEYLDLRGGIWRKLKNEDLHNLFASQIIIKVMNL
jgi:hypothetical protein